MGKKRFMYVESAEHSCCHEFTIKDQTGESGNDGRICECYTLKEAELVVNALNESKGSNFTRINEGTIAIFPDGKEYTYRSGEWIKSYYLGGVVISNVTEAGI